MEPEILVNVSLRLPQADRRALASHLAPIIKEAIIAGEMTLYTSLCSHMILMRSPISDLNTPYFFQILGRIKFAAYNRRKASILTVLSLFC